MDYAYKGDQWFSVNEIPCIPWISQEVWNICIYIYTRTHAHTIYLIICNVKIYNLYYILHVVVDTRRRQN